MRKTVELPTNQATPNELEHRVAVRDLVVDCVVGVYARERGVPQPLHVDIELFLKDVSWSLPSVSSQTVDYAWVSESVVFVLENVGFRYLESAACALQAMLYCLFPTVAAVRVELRKPRALASGLAVVQMSSTRQAEPFLRREEKPWGAVDVLWEQADAGVYLLRIAAGREIPRHVHRHMAEVEMVASDHLKTNGTAYPRGTRFAWPCNFAHVHQADQSEEAHVLCVDRPKFLPDDEVLTADGLVAPPAQAPRFVCP